VKIKILRIFLTFHLIIIPPYPKKKSENTSRENVKEKCIKETCDGRKVIEKYE